MSLVEMAHRVSEVCRKLIDRHTARDWSDFGAFGGALEKVWIAASPVWLDLTQDAATTAEAIHAGRLRFLNRDWPQPDRRDWWASDIWRRDPVSGLLWPGPETFAFDAAYRHDTARGDVKFVWELNRLQFLPALAASGEDGIETAFDILGGWMTANPPYRGINWASGIEAASRLVSVLALVGLVERPFSDAESRSLRAFIEAHAFSIDRYPSLYSSANNHRVAELTALYLSGLAVPGMRSAARYRTTGAAGLEHEIQRQVHPDGVGAEQSLTYAAYSLEWFALAGMAAGEVGEPMSGAYRSRAAAAAEHLRWMIDESGRAPRIGDDDEGRVLAFRPENADGYPKSVAQMTERWLGLEIEPETPRLGVRTFAQGGYTVARKPTARGMTLFAFDHGPLGFLSIAAHGHADALSVWMHWGDEPILVDAGTWLYHAGAGVRDAYRGTQAHNTLSLDGQNQSRILGPFNWSDHAEVRLLEASQTGAVAEHLGYQRRYGLIHRRAVTFDEDGYGIEDRLIGHPARRGSRWRIGYLLHPDVEVQIDGPRARLTTAAGRRLIMTLEAGPNWRVEIGSYSPRFNQQIQTRRLVIDGLLAPGADPLVAKVTIDLCA